MIGICLEDHDTDIVIGESDTFDVDVLLASIHIVHIILSMENLSEDYS